MTTATLSPKTQKKTNEGKGGGLQAIVTQNMRIAMAMRGVSQVETTEHYVAMPDGRLREATAAVRPDV